MMDGCRKRKRDLVADGDDSEQKQTKFPKVSQSYSDLLVLPAAAMPRQLHKRVQGMLARLHAAGLLLHDLAYVSGKVITPSVKRVLFGRRGMTYRYLNLRLFAYPWEPYTIEAVDTSKAHQWPVMAPCLYPEVCELNQFYESAVHHYRTAIQKEQCSCVDHEFNVALINFWDPEDQRCHRLLRTEPYFGMGDLAVSWHSDSNLVNGSPVAVYSHTVSGGVEEHGGHGNNHHDDPQWGVGFKIQWDTEGDGLCVHLSDGDSYAMLNKMNTTHQHCVVAGSEARYSSTHRKAVMEYSMPCWDGIHSMCMNALLPFSAFMTCPPPFLLSSLSMPSTKQYSVNLQDKSTNSLSDNSQESCSTDCFFENVSRCVKEGLFSDSLLVSSFTQLLSCLCEVESEWLRQFWWQGAVRAATHCGFWLPRVLWLEWSWIIMHRLLGVFFHVLLEGMNVKMADYISANAQSFTKLVKKLHRLQDAREEWHQRYSAKVIAEENCYPIKWPIPSPGLMDNHPIHLLQLKTQYILPWILSSEESKAWNKWVFLNLPQLLTTLHSHLDQAKV